MKKYLIVLCIIISINIFASINLEKLSLGKDYISFVFTGKSIPKYSLSYTPGNNMIFIEFIGVKSENIQNRNINGNYIKKIESLAIEGNIDFFITLHDNVEYSIKKSSKSSEVIVKFKNKKLKKDYTITIDAGHGGKDPGALGLKKIKEKNIVFQVAKRLKKKLNSRYHVYMTRKSDIFVPLYERSEISNKHNSDLLISIHTNANKHKNSHGTEVFYYSKSASAYANSIAAFENEVDKKFGIEDNYTQIIVNDLFYHLNQEKSMHLAALLGSKISKNTGFKRRGSFGANFAVLRYSNSPAVLVELGFITNYDNATKLLSSKYQKKITDAIYNAVNKYFY